MKLSTTMLTGAAALSKLKTLHPIVIEGGTGRRDGRDPDEVARKWLYGGGALEPDAVKSGKAATTSVT